MIYTTHSCRPKAFLIKEWTSDLNDRTSCGVRGYYFLPFSLWCEDITFYCKHVDICVCGMCIELGSLGLPSKISTLGAFPPTSNPGRHSIAPDSLHLPHPHFFPTFWATEFLRKKVSALLKWVVVGYIVFLPQTRWLFKMLGSCRTHLYLLELWFLVLGFWVQAWIPHSPH